MKDKTTITWTAVTIKLHGVDKHTINNHPEDTCTDAEINAVEGFIRNWRRTHPKPKKVI